MDFITAFVAAPYLSKMLFAK